MKTNLLRFSIIGIIFICSVGHLKATHIQGAYISYQYVDTNKYLVSVTLYRDCYGVPAPVFVTVCYSSANSGISGNINLYPITGTGNTIPVSTCYIQPVTPCSVGGGREEWIYSDTLTLPQPATDWVFSYIAQNFYFPFNTNVNAYVKTTLDNVTFPVNSSPAFNDTVYFVYCMNTLSTINYSCTDADGDSLHYTLVGGIDGSGNCPYATTPVIYSPPFSPTNPVSSSTPVILSATGLLQFTPNQLQVATICLIIEEFRNGILIGSLTRDDEIIVTQNAGAGIEDVHKQFNATISPNPFTSQLNIAIENNEQVHFQLTDITGRILVEQDFIHDATIASQDLAPGIYFYHLSDNKNNSRAGKLVKE